MRVAAFLSAGLLFVACGGDDTEVSPTTTTASEAVDSQSESPVVSSTPDSAGEPIGVAERADVSAFGVILAAVLLASGDVEQAVADGVVTAAEVDAAAAAVRDDTLSQWAVLADASR